MDVWSMNYTGAGIVVAVVDEGLNTTHPELSKAYDRNASRDFVEDDAIPEPNDAYIMSGHGSKCAGVIAAKGNNGHCGVGLAYNARIGGIRLFKNAMATDMTEADALSFNRDYIHIYSNSWGPDDRGFEVKGPGKATKEKLKEGATEGRKGKGSIFVFAAGNGGIISKDSCAYNGYVNSIYTIAISSVNRDGSVPLYGERCPGIMATAFSRDSFGDRNPVVTAGQNGQCEFFFGGSSASAAMASGLIALTLEANTNLTWRDVQHIIARSARFPRRYPSDLVTNGAGLKVSNYIGFGLMDALKMVNFAQKWNNVPKQRQCEIFQNDSTNDRSHTSEINLRSWPYSCGVRIRFLEHVQVRVNLEVWPRGDLLLSLKSPSGTVSRLTQHRPFDRFQSISKNLTDWVILTLHHWGEDPEGTWKLKIHGNYRSLKFSGWSLVLYGTSSDPLKDNPHVHSTPPVSKKPDSTRKETGYIVEITTGYRNRHGYQYTRPIRSDAKIQLFGEDGETVQHRLTPSGSSKSSQLYYIRDNQVGNLTKVQIIKEKGDGKTYYVNEVAIRQEGNNSWIVLQHKGYLWRHGSVTTIKRACQRGFQRGYKDECVDINECDGRNNDCPRINGECVNTHGSYYCKCKPGFQLHESRYRSYDGTWRRWKTCSDINECHRGISGCSHRCENDQGSYHCTCPTGFRLYNGRTCHDINECREGSHGCDHECSNTQGSYDCKCKTGFHLSRYNSKTCFDIDECHRGISGCSHTCQNDQGSYHCTCPIGFQLLHDQRTCTCPKGFKLSHDQRKCLGLDCIRVGSWVWGLWTQKGNSTNYFRARITRIEDNLIEFFLEVNNKQSRRYNRTTPVLIVDKIPDTVSVDERVIAVHKSRKPEWYRTGTVKSTDTATNGKLQALVKFDNGDERLAELNQIRSVKRPRVCMDNI